jgi:hypothetical protein
MLALMLQRLDALGYRCVLPEAFEGAGDDVSALAGAT